jgi:flagellar protein FlbD
VIQLTRLNNKPLAVNSDLIKFIEKAPDTVLTLLNDEKVLVRESMEEVIDRIIAFRRTIIAGLSSAGGDVNFAAGAPHGVRSGAPAGEAGRG